MPPAIFERLPLPSLRSYVTFTAALFCLALYSSHGRVPEVIELLRPNETESSATSWADYGQCMMLIMTNELWCVLSVINTAYCFVILIGKAIQEVVFGPLRVIELQHLKDHFWNFVFYKFIFVFGVMNVQDMDEVVLWSAWFSVMGALHMLTQLCKDRFEYLSCSPTTPKLSHIKLLFLLVLVTLLSFCLMAFAVLVGIWTDINTFTFLVAECLLLLVRSIYVLLRYCIYLYDVNHDGLWENRGILTYYSELTCELAALSIDLIHHIHMIIWSNIILSMASLVILMQIRYLYNEMVRRISRHRNYLLVVRNMEARFPVAEKSVLERNNDNCAICWDRMESARSLPCGHLFHSSCLRSWLEQDTSCPTCRVPLGNPRTSEATTENTDRPGESRTTDHQELNGRQHMPQVVAPQPQLNRSNHFFHFNASRYVSWLPSFSVEVTHTQLVPDQRNAARTSQLNTMAREVHSVFPLMSLNAIIDDLRNTHSVEITIDNILEGRLTVQSTVHDRRQSTDSFESLGENGERGEDITDPIESRDANSTAVCGNTMLSGSSEDAATSETDERGTSDCSIANEVSCPISPAARFSKDSSERETSLRKRKDALLRQAQERYKTKHDGAHNLRGSDH